MQDAYRMIQRGADYADIETRIGNYTTASLSFNQWVDYPTRRNYIQPHG